MVNTDLRESEGEEERGGGLRYLCSPAGGNNADPFHVNRVGPAGGSPGGGRLGDPRGGIPLGIPWRPPLGSPGVYYGWIVVSMSLCDGSGIMQCTAAADSCCCCCRCCRCCPVAAVTSRSHHRHRYQHRYHPCDHSTTATTDITTATLTTELFFIHLAKFRETRTSDARGACGTQSGDAGFTKIPKCLGHNHLLSSF